MKSLFCSLLLMTVSASAETPTSDAYLWLEDVTGQRSLDWVRERNAIASRELEAQPGFAAMQARLLSIYESQDRIPYVSKQGKYFYTYWRDANQVRGVWRRTTLDEYRKSTPAWETVLDLDILAAKEKENWVWAGVTCLHPTYDRCLVQLSRGGGDAKVVREFDVEKKELLSAAFNCPRPRATSLGAVAMNST
jgi:prolyl oligopeptidase